MKLVTDWRAAWRWPGRDRHAGERALQSPARRKTTRNWRGPTRRCAIFCHGCLWHGHRAEASTHGVGRFAPVACAGPLLEGELNALEKPEPPARPMVAIVGGSKVSTKLTVLETLADKVDQLVVGGGIANTFPAASGKPVGKSCEHELIPMPRP